MQNQRGIQSWRKKRRESSENAIILKQDYDILPICKQYIYRPYYIDRVSESQNPGEVKICLSDVIST